MANKKLTADLLAGIEQTEDMDIEVAGEQYSITIRPLTVAERAKVTAMSQKGMKLRGNVQGPTADIQDIMLATAEADTMAVAIGMVDPVLSKTQLDKSLFPVDEVAKAIKRLSGMPVSDDDKEPEVKHAEGAEFRENEA